jgi:hypothetical protein
MFFPGEQVGAPSDGIGMETTMTTILRFRSLMLTLALLALFLLVCLLVTLVLLHAGHPGAPHLFADSSTPDIIIYNH